MVPSRGSRKRSRNSENGPAKAFTEPELRAKAAGEEEDGSLKGLNEQRYSKLFSHWEIDFLSMEISPGGIPILALFWEVGGSVARPIDSDFPFGLEISSSPFTLRIQRTRYDTVNEHHEEAFRTAAKELRQVLQDCGDTGHPILAAPDTAEQQALQLAKKQRFCTGEQLAAALECCHPAAEWQILVCKYGMKIKASSFFETLQAMGTKMEEEMGQLRARTAWKRKVVDYGSQALLTGRICRVAPLRMNYFHQVDAQKASRYSLFGSIGGGFGGVELPGADGMDFLIFIAYSGTYTHQLKAIGAPRAFPPRQAQQTWFAQQWAQVQACLASLDKLQDIEVAGLRFEVRSTSETMSWRELEVELQSLGAETAAHLAFKEVDFQDAMEHMKVALGECQACGLFQCMGSATTRAPGWKYSALG